MNGNELIRKETMTSLEIAEVTGKRHSDVLEAIRNMETAWAKITERKFPLSVYTDSTGRKQPCFVLNKTECLYVATKFNDEARAKLVLRWEELEKEKVSVNIIPTTFAEALRLAADQAEQIEQQQKQLEANSREIVAMNNVIASMQPKITYLDKILSSKETVTTTQIAQDYGMSAKSFNILLRNFGIQHKVGGQWVLYAKHLPCGYVQSDTIQIEHKDGSSGSIMHTKWTQKGRLFLYDELKKHNIIPTIEK